MGLVIMTGAAFQEIPRWCALLGCSLLPYDGLLVVTATRPCNRIENSLSSRNETTTTFRDVGDAKLKLVTPLSRPLADDRRIRRRSLAVGAVLFVVGFLLQLIATF